ncbi:MAG: dihydrofolate reductase [Gammaproteobacteria bacterium]|nr:dihydrofolate reductase [Gammaproteobacteria bacterium]
MYKFILIIPVLLLLGCSQQETPVESKEKVAIQTEMVTEVTKDEAAPEFQWEVDRFEDLRVLRYQVPGFESLPLEQKKLLYYLSEAALAGRDIMYDQNYRLNLTIRRTLEAIVADYEGNRSSDLYAHFMTYLKQIWFASGIHHHYSNDKFVPEFTATDLNQMVKDSPNASFPTRDGETVEQLLARIEGPIFDPNVDAKKITKTKGMDVVTNSAVNFYQGVTEKEARDFYATKSDPNDKQPVSTGLNSQLVKNDDGTIVERVWKVGGMYGQAMEKSASWLDKAITVAENSEQKKALALLAKYFRSGDLKDFDDYSVAWVKDINSDVDVINGFIEVYQDPLALKGSFESVVSVRNPQASKLIDKIAQNAQWFEDNMPMDDRFKKEKVKGIIGKSIIVVMESGDSSPTTPIGINLPNSHWIRAEHGSKSVSLGNIVNAYNQSKGASLAEFAWDEAEIKRVKKYGNLASELNTDMHEVIGHASGKLLPGVGTPQETMGQHSSTLEEARADLVGLYYLTDPKLQEIGVLPSDEVAMAGYDSYIRNGMMTQLNRIKLGNDIEQAHMRNRQIVSSWAYEKGLKDNVIEKRVRDNKTYFVINNYGKLRVLFGELLGEIQRIKSEGDSAAGEALVDNYGIKIDPDLHKEVLNRYESLNVAPYSGFVNPNIVPVMDNGEIIDVLVQQPKDFVEQMMHYAKNYSYLPNDN